MALVACRECGNQISKKAPSCPACGAPRKRKTSTVTWLITIFVVAPFMYLVLRDIAEPSSQPPQRPDRASIPAKPKTPALDKSAAHQQMRKEFIEKLIKTGFFSKVEVPGTLPRVWVTPNFYVLKFDEKQTFIEVVYAYYFDGTRMGDSVRVIDDYSGKEIGTYSLGNPGLKMK